MRRLLAVLAVLSCSPAYSQGFEGSLVGGYTTSGAIDHQALGITDLNIKGNFTWGASLGYSLTPRLGLEASWSWQKTALEIGTAAGSAELFDVDVNLLQASLLYQFGGEKATLRPFVSSGLGVAFLGAPQLDTETKLSLGLGAGLKWQPQGKLGARLQARYTPTYLNDSGSDFCDPFGFCQDWLHQFEFTGGVVVRF
jgi:opacity protein-like surface antigen